MVSGITQFDLLIILFNFVTAVLIMMTDAVFAVFSHVNICMNMICLHELLHTGAYDIKIVQSSCSNNFVLVDRSFLVTVWEHSCRPEDVRLALSA